MNLQILQVAVLVPDMKKLLVCIFILLFVKKKNFKKIYLPEQCLLISLYLLLLILLKTNVLILQNTQSTVMCIDK